MNISPSFYVQVPAFIVLVLSLTVSADEHRIDISTFERMLRDHSKAYNNTWEYWGLTQEEWTRYESLKQKSPWGLWKNDATPLAVLSHYSDSIAEKSRYARLEAELDQWRENTTLEFQQLYNKQREIVFAKQSAVIRSRKPELKSIKPSDRILYFVQAGECNPRCRTLTHRLLGSAAHIDIFVMGAKREKDIFAWAEKANIPIDRVQVKQVTLNFDSGLLAVVTTTPKSLLEFPMAYLKTKDDYRAVIF